MSTTEAPCVSLKEEALLKKKNCKEADKKEYFLKEEALLKKMNCNNKRELS